jgi:hypothetical protein
MRWCEKCDTEYEHGEHCKCVTYRKRMEHGLEFMVPIWWIRDWWDGPWGNENKHHPRRPQKDGTSSW